MTSEYSQSRSQQSREHILAAAANLFKDKGYAATTLRHIAHAVGIKAGSIYYHFPSKEALLLEVLNTGLQRLIDSVKACVEALPAETDWRTRIEAAMQGHIQAVLANGDFFSANIRVFRQLSEELQAQHTPLRDSYGAYWDELLTQAQAEGALRSELDPHALRRSLLGCLNSPVEWHREDQGDTPERTVTLLAGLLLDGVMTCSDSE